MPRLPTRLLLALAVTFPAPASAQRFLPENVPAFELPYAAPLASGFAGRIIAVTRGDSRFGSGTEADVVLAEALPVVTLSGGRKPWALDFLVGTQARFSLSDPKSGLISNDWTVGFTAHGPAHKKVELAVQLYHESSHLGDEYSERFNVRRLDWTREIALGWVGIRMGQARLRLAAGSAYADQLDLPGGLAVVAIDYRGKDGFLGRSPGRLIAGVHMEFSEAVNWRSSTTARVAIELGRDARHRVALGLIAHDGLSTQRQFYRESSRYVGGEIRFDL